MSFLTHFDSITKGVIEIRDFLFYVSVIIFWLFLNVIIVEFKNIIIMRIFRICVV